MWSSSSSSSTAAEQSEQAALVDERENALIVVARSCMVVLAEVCCLKKSAVGTSDADAATLRQQAVNDLLKSKDLQSLLLLLLGLYTRHLHKELGGKPTAAGLATPALTNSSSSSSSSSSRQQRRKQQRQRQRQRQQQVQPQQQQEEQQQLLVPPWHMQLLEQFGISEKSLAGSLLDSAAAGGGVTPLNNVFVAVRVLQLLLVDGPQQQGRTQQNSRSSSVGLGNSSSSSSSTNGSSSKVAWQTEMLTAVLQTIVEAQVRLYAEASQHNCS
jgi:hypothetical protein